MPLLYSYGKKKMQQQLCCERKSNQDRPAKAELYTLQRLIIFHPVRTNNRLLNKGRRWAIKYGMQSALGSSQQQRWVPFAKKAR